MRGWIRASTVAPGLAVLLVSATVQDVVLLAMASLVLPLAACWLAGHVPKMVAPKVGFEPSTVGLRNGQAGVRRGPKRTDSCSDRPSRAPRDISASAGVQRRGGQDWWSTAQRLVASPMDAQPTDNLWQIGDRDVEYDVELESARARAH